MLVKFLEQGDAVVLQAKLDLRARDGGSNVEYSVWYGSLLDLTMSQIGQLYDYHVLLQDSVRFIPRIMTHSCEDCGEAIKQESCVSSGKYCLIKPKNAVLKTEPGMQLSGLLEEGLRERCIFEILEDKRVKAGQTRDDLHLLFNYMYNVRLSCIDD
jgi:hypothetical protein